MDRAIREAERAGDYDRAGRLRCRGEGCIRYKIESISSWENYETNCWMIELNLHDDRQMKIAISMGNIYRASNSVQYVKDTIWNECIQHLAHCPRCEKTNGLGATYTREVLDGLRSATGDASY